MERKISTRLGLALTAVILAGMLLAGCGNRLSEADVPYAGPVIDNILQAIAAKDYGKFSLDFSENMKTGIGEKDFSALAAKMETRLGRYEAKSFLSAAPAKNPNVDLTIVKYRAKYSNESDVTITVYFSDTGVKKLIEGLLIDSPALDK